MKQAWLARLAAASALTLLSGCGVLSWFTSTPPKAPPPPQALKLLEQQKPDGPLTQLPENYVDTPVPPDPELDKPKPDDKGKDPKKGGPKKSTGSSTRQLNPDGTAVVLDTKSKGGAARAGVGWLSLFTVPPTAVYDGPTNLGTTPLVKVPLEEGTYRLRLVDPDGQNRMLSAPIKPGQETKLKIRVTDLPLEN